MTNHGEVFNEEEIESLIYYAKPNNEGKINYRDFVRLMMSKQI